MSIDYILLEHYIVFELFVYLWHIKQAVEQHLSSKKQIIQIRYNAQEAYNQCSIINPHWQPTIFCNINFSNNNLQIKSTAHI